MKVKALLLKEFVKKASLNGKIMTINMEFTEDGILSRVMDFSGTTLTVTKLKVKAIEDYVRLPEIFIKNTKSFMMYLNSFDDIMELELKDDYILKLSDEHRKGHILLGSAQVCENKYSKDEPSVNYTTTFKLEKGDLYKAIRDTVDLAFKQIEFSKKGPMLKLSVGEKENSDYFENFIDTKSEGDGYTKIGENLIDFYNVVEGEIELRFGTNVPIKLTNITENIEYFCIIAPIVSD